MRHEKGGPRRVVFFEQREGEGLPSRRDGGKGEWGREGVCRQGSEAAKCFFSLGADMPTTQDIFILGGLFGYF